MLLGQVDCPFSRGIFQQLVFRRSVVHFELYLLNSAAKVNKFRLDTNLWGA
jgi:hypothetical protein